MGNVRWNRELIDLVGNEIDKFSFLHGYSLVFCLLLFAGMAAGAVPEIVMVIYGRIFLPTGPLSALLIFAAMGLTMISVITSILISAGWSGSTFVFSNMSTV